MGIFKVLTFPHPILAKQAKPVREFDSALKSLAAAMLETMYKQGGIGLAANQVGQLKQLLVMDLQPREGEGENTVVRREPQVFVNPRIVDARGQTALEEACLSVPDFTAEISRAASIVVEYETLEGSTVQRDAEGMAAVCLQHEMDHLRGKLFIDHLPPVRRQLIKKRLAKLARTG